MSLINIAHLPPMSGHWDEMHDRIPHVKPHRTQMTRRERTNQYISSIRGGDVESCKIDVIVSLVYDLGPIKDATAEQMIVRVRDHIRAQP